MEKYRGIPDGDTIFEAGERWHRISSEDGKPAVEKIPLGDVCRYPRRPISWGLIACCVALGYVLGYGHHYASTVSHPRQTIEHMERIVAAQAEEERDETVR